MSNGAINLWVSPEGRELVIPEDVFAATTFRKNGWPDKRVKTNAMFWKWLDGLKAEAEPERSDLAAKVMASRAGGDNSDEIARRRAVGLARRVWEGQSPSLPRKERLERVRKALEKQGLSMEGVEL